MFQLKPLHDKALAAALQKAERYRLLNEPLEAESICRDVLDRDPANAGARRTLILALTDQFPDGLAGRVDVATELARELDDEYDREYYLGIISERRAKIHLDQPQPGSNDMAYDFYRKALEHFARAEELSADDNDDAILRWNTIVRTLNGRPELVAPDDSEEIALLE